MLTWKEENGIWYCYKTGVMVKGWVQDENSKWYHLDETNGKMDTGWIQIDSKWYYLYPKQTVNYGITYPTGAMAVDWTEIDSRWYYLYTEKTEKDGTTHYKGEMALGWVQIDSRWYYLYPKQTVNYEITYPMGAMAVDWVRLNSKWYYLLKVKTEYNGNTHYRGEMVASTTITINNKSYTFDASGIMQEGSNGLYSEKLIEFIKGWEAFYSHAYPDPYDNSQACWTIGYGTTYQVKSSAFPNGLSSTCTIGQADQWVREEATAVAKRIKSALDAKGELVSQQAFDCLCDIGYNAGTGALIYGNTWNAIISGDANSIETQIMKWSGTSGGTSPGLVKRCRARVNMCLYGTYDSTH